MNSEYTIRYQNVIIRPLREDDLEILRKTRNDKEVSKYLRKISHLTKEDQLKWYEKILKEEKEIVFAIEEDEVLNRCVGSCSLYDMQEDSAYFGKIAIDPAARGLKTGLNAMRSVIHFAFDTYDLKEIFLTVNRDNEVAKRRYLQIGFKVLKELNEQEELMSLDKERFYHINEIGNDVIISKE